MGRTVCVNGQDVRWEDQLTLDSLLQRFDFGYRIFVVKINGEIVRKSQYTTKIVPENAHIKIIPLLSGG
ncbi:MAG: sulfur carrier protein ThiS [Candidatus Aminicenantes bacterium]|jgi:thiamine biosynthesis protein ThiS